MNILNEGPINSSGDSSSDVPPESSSRLIVLQLPYFCRCAFREKVTHSISENINWQSFDMCIIVNSNFVWSESEFDRHIGLRTLTIFVERDCVSANPIIAYINMKMKPQYGYKITETEDDVGNKVFECRRSSICIAYMTDKSDEAIQNCKDGLYRYCLKYKYNFLHLYTNEIHDYRDPKDRLEVLANLHYTEDYVFVLYNYSVIVNQKIPLSATAESMFEKNEHVHVKIDTEFGMPVLENFAFRNSGRAIDILKEFTYFAYDPVRLMRYIRFQLFKEVTFTSFYSYFNKRMTLAHNPVSFDLGYNFNTLALTHMEQVNMLVKYYQYHHCVFEPLMRLSGKTYIWGGDSKGCLGKITFVDWRAIQTSWGETGIYEWIHANQYTVELNEERYKITVLDDGKMFIGYSEKTSNRITGMLYRD